MFKFFWGKGSHQSAERLKIQKELFQFQKVISIKILLVAGLSLSCVIINGIYFQTAQHGFPSKPTSLAWDPVLRLLCIGTRTGAIKM